MDRDSKSNLDRQQGRAALRDAVPAIIALIVLEAAVAALDLKADSDGWHLAVTLSPMLAGVWLVWVHLRTIRRSDEYQRMLHLEALSIGFAVAMLIAMAGGLLSGGHVGSDAQYLQVTFIAGVLAWVGALAVRTRR